jgi:hypothetical protein
MWMMSAKLSILAFLKARVDTYMSGFSLHTVERVKGIEPLLFAWEAKVLPLNDTR